MTNGLTGLANRKCFDRKLEQAVEAPPSKVAAKA